MNICIKRNMWLVAALLGCLIMALPVRAASFDCGKAETKVEKLVCDNPVISKLDDKLGKTYQNDLNKANDEERQRLITEQKHWLKYTRNVCSNEACFKHAYWSRLAELETFFEPHSPLYKKEAEKADAIKQVLATVPLYESTFSNPPFCRQVFEDLKRMKDIYFVDPVVQVQSYEDPALDPLKLQCKGKEPLHFSYTCDPKLYPGDIEQIGAECSAGYGLPPFKLFELSLLQASGEKRYVFYSDDDYGPMNEDWSPPHPGGGYAAGFDKLILPGCKHQGSSTRAHGGARNGSNYNSVIKYNNQYYLLNLFKEYISYRLSIELVTQSSNSACRWTSVKTNTSK